MTNCVPAAQMVRLLLAPVVEPPENSCRMNRVFSIFLLLPVMAMVICRGKPSGSVFVNTNEKDFIDKMGVYDVVPRSDAAEKGCRVIRTRWVTVNKGCDDAPQLRARWVA